MKVYNSEIMKISIFFIFLILISYQGQAQVYGKIDYAIKLIFNPIDSLEQHATEPQKPNILPFSKKLEQSKNLLPILNFTLEFNNTQALFYKQNMMASDFDKDILEYALILSNSKEDYYSDFSSDSSNVYKQSELGGKHYLVKKKNHDWQLSNETKEIAGYLCRKATTREKRNDIITLTITAWYCPDLPYNYGPKNFAGLPGMILGLEEHGFYFYAKNVNLKEKEHKIKKPKGEIVSQENFIQLLEKSYENQINNY